jgi:hypothetical protein
MPLEPWFQRYLDEHAAAGTPAPACPGCRRPLVRLTEPRCPHCGCALALGLKIEEPFLLPWGIALACVTAVAGLGLFLDALIAWRGSMPLTAFLLGLYAIMAAGVVFAGLGLGLLLGRRRFLRLNRDVQWLCAIIGILSAVAATMLFAVSLP